MVWYLYLSEPPFSHLEIVDGAIVALFASSLTDKCLPSLYFFPTYEIMTSTLLSSTNLHLPDRGYLYKYTISKETHCKILRTAKKILYFFIARSQCHQLSEHIIFLIFIVHQTLSHSSNSTVYFRYIS